MYSRQLIVEFIGTFFLLLVVGLTANPVAVGFALAALVYLGAAISGGHYNPAVTVAVYLGKGIPGKRIWGYFVAQFLGAAAAALTYLAIKGDFLIIEPGQGVSSATAILIEALFTFLLTMTVLQVAVSKRTTGNQYFGLAIGLSLLVGAVAGGAISGGAFNPAIGITPALVSGIDISPSASVYTAGPLLGALLAGLLYRFLESGTTTVTKGKK